MITGSIARRYAKALLAIGVETKKFEKQGQEIDKFARLMENKELRDTMENPSYPLSNRKAVIQQLIKRLRPSKTVENFLLLLTDRGRLTALPGIAREYQRMADDHMAQLRASVISADRLDSASVTRLKKALEQKTGKKIILKQSTDPELIAGMVTQIGSIVYDGSIRTRLDQMRQALIEGEQ